MLPGSTRKAEFFPLGPLHGKRNYKQYFYIQRDGSILERVHLDVPDPSRREELICCHYLRHLARHFLSQDTGVNVVGRDAPWDFSLEMSSGEAFFVEITSIADSQRLFEINKREERLAYWIGHKHIPLYELKKLAFFFSDGELEKAVLDYERQEQDPSAMVPNPLLEGRTTLFLSNIPEPEKTLSQLLRSATEQKVAKSHDGKEKVILIIDNRTGTFDVEDYRIAAGALANYFEGIPFREIWFYTGYYSDDDGNNAEFSFAPLKVTTTQMEVLRNMEVDSNGSYVW